MSNLTKQNMEINYVDKWLELTRSEIPLISKVEQDKLTFEACNLFDYKNFDESVFYPWLKPALPTEFKIGLIIGSSGSGKSQLLKTFNNVENHIWLDNKSIISHFDTVKDATDKFYAVGLSSVPTWTKPHKVLSNGEKFRADLAKSLIDNAVIDEFTSVVDRNVAISASKSLHKYINQSELKNIVFASCHRDIIPWLKPDWIIDLDAGMYCLEPKECLRLEPLVAQVFEVKRTLWDYFMGHHYLSKKLHPFARCYIATIQNQIISFSAAIPFPNRFIKRGWREHRTVTIPDFQGLGVGVRLSDWVAEAHVRNNYRYFSRTAHPRMGEYREHSPNWKATSNNKKLQKSNNNPNWSHWNFDDKRLAYSHEFIIDPEI